MPDRRFQPTRYCARLKRPISHLPLDHRGALKQSGAGLGSHPGPWFFLASLDTLRDGSF
jgi:hypothetical protein